MTPVSQASQQLETTESLRVASKTPTLVPKKSTSKTTHNPKFDVTIQDESLGVRSVCDLFKSCVEEYETLLSALQSNARHSEYLTNCLIPEAKDEFSRLHIWGEQTCAVFPEAARRSLDQQLRDKEEIKQIVMRSLERLERYIGRGLSSDHHDS
jgi:hypothetical protein